MVDPNSTEFIAVECTAVSLTNNLPVVPVVKGYVLCTLRNLQRKHRTWNNGTTYVQQCQPNSAQYVRNFRMNDMGSVPGYK